MKPRDLFTLTEDFRTLFAELPLFAPSHFQSPKLQSDLQSLGMRVVPSGKEILLCLPHFTEEREFAFLRFLMDDQLWLQVLHDSDSEKLKSELSTMEWRGASIFRDLAGP